MYTKEIVMLPKSFGSIFKKDKAVYRTDRTVSIRIYVKAYVTSGGIDPFPESYKHARTAAAAWNARIVHNEENVKQ